MGLENSESRINPGLIQAANLVPGTQDYTIAGKGVSNMQAAMKDGFITAADVAERFSHRHALKQQLESKALKNAIAQQNAEATLIAPRAALQGAQTDAALQILPKQAALANTQIAGAQHGAEFSNQMQPDQEKLVTGQVAQALSELGSGIPTQTVRQLDLMFGLGAKWDPQTGVLQNAEEVRPKLVGVMRMQRAVGIADELGKRVDQSKLTHPDGREETVPVWKDTGKPLTPDEKNLFEGARSMIFGTVNPGQSTATAPAPTAAPAVNGDQTGQTGPNGGMMTKGTPAPTEMALRDEVAKDPAYQQWRKSVGSFEKLNATWTDIQAKMKSDPKGNFKADDIELASNFIKLYDPEAVIREFKWDKLQDARDWADTIANAKDLIAGKSTLTPQQRENLVKVSQNTFHAQEKAIQSHVKQYADLEVKYGYKNVLNDDARAILNRAPEAAPTAGTPAAAPAPMTKSYGGKTWNLGASYSKPDGTSWTVVSFDSAGKPQFEAKR